MHGRRNALILAACLAAAVPAMADKDAAAGDAAVKVQEGNVEQWIEYYRRSREAALPDAAGKPAGAAGVAAPTPGANDPPAAKK